MIVSLDEVKKYLRVDSDEEDDLIGTLQVSAEQLCKDVGRISDARWEDIAADDIDEENGIIVTSDLSDGQLEFLRGLIKTAVLYAIGYLYEHRDEADHHALTMTLRSILFAVREGAF